MESASTGSAAESGIKRVAILFSGGPAPAANAVISTAAVSFLRNGISVAGIRYGYSGLEQYGPDHSMVADRDYIEITSKHLKRTRNTQGIMLGTARNNPGKFVSHPDHFNDPDRTAPLKTVYDALRSMNVDALVSIGGDDTLKNGQQTALVSRTSSRRPTAVADCACPENDRQRLLRHRFHVRVFYCGGDPSQ